MSFYDALQAATETERKQLFSAPIITRALTGDIRLAEYAAFLGQAYHHVKHTVPLLMAAGSRLAHDKEWLRSAIAEYIDEEIGHEQWILDDIAACGYDPERARDSKPCPSTELMVAYAYDTIYRINPVGFFGMVQVLEGTSIALATRAADQIQCSLQLPDQAFSYLRSHGALDLEHIRFFESLMNRIDDSAEQQLIIHCAKMFYRLYGDIFRTLSAARSDAFALEDVA